MTLVSLACTIMLGLISLWQTLRVRALIGVIHEERRCRLVEREQLQAAVDVANQALRFVTPLQRKAIREAFEMLKINTRGPS